MRTVAQWFNKFVGRNSVLIVRVVRGRRCHGEEELPLDNLVDGLSKKKLFPWVTER